jgi:hypothetical protein
MIQYSIKISSSCKNMCQHYINKIFLETVALNTSIPLQLLIPNELNPASGNALIPPPSNVCVGDRCSPSPDTKERAAHGRAQPVRVFFLLYNIFL